MVNAGADVIQVMAFYGSSAKLESVGKGDLMEVVNEMATRVAREVAGDLSTTLSWREDDADAAQLTSRMLDEQIEAQAAVDFFIGETFHHLGEALLCLERIKHTSGLPAMITMSFRADATTPDGFTAGECAAKLSDAGADIVGVNTACGIQSEPIRSLGRCVEQPTHTWLHSPSPTHVRTRHPGSRGSSAFPDRLEPTRMTRYQMADFAVRARDLGVNYIGSCCGSGAVHVREMARALGKVSVDPHWSPDPDSPMSDTEYNRRRVRGSAD